MRYAVNLAAGTLLALTGLGLMAYTVYELHGIPVLCGVVLAWLGFVEYVVVSAWWPDAHGAFRGKGRHVRRPE